MNKQIIIDALFNFTRRFNDLAEATDKTAGNYALKALLSPINKETNEKEAYSNEAQSRTYKHVINQLEYFIRSELPELLKKAEAPQ